MIGSPAGTACCASCPSPPQLWAGHSKQAVVRQYRQAAYTQGRACTALIHTTPSPTPHKANKIGNCTLCTLPLSTQYPHYSLTQRPRCMMVINQYYTVLHSKLQYCVLLEEGGNSYPFLRTRNFVLPVHSLVSCMCSEKLPWVLCDPPVTSVTASARMSPGSPSGITCRYT